MKQNYTLYIYKSDKRTKSGERLVSTTVWTDRDDAGMKRECANLFDTYKLIVIPHGAATLLRKRTGACKG
jgi:hypothetical protein